MTTIIARPIDKVKKSRDEILAEGRAKRAANILEKQNKKSQLSGPIDKIIKENKAIISKEKKDDKLTKALIRSTAKRFKNETTYMQQIAELQAEYGKCQMKITAAKNEAAQKVNYCKEEQKAIRLKQAQLRRLEKKKGTFVSKRKPKQ